MGGLMLGELGRRGCVKHGAGTLLERNTEVSRQGPLGGLRPPVLTPSAVRPTVMARTALLLLALLLSACGSSAVGQNAVIAESADGRFEQISRGEVKIWRSINPSTDSSAAEVAGSFGYDSTCGAYLYNEEFDQRYPVVWPAGTAISESGPLTLELPDGGAIEVGQEVVGAGGFDSEVNIFDGRCSSTGQTAIFNASGEVQ